MPAPSANPIPDGSRPATEPGVSGTPPTSQQAESGQARASGDIPKSRQIELDAKLSGEIEQAYQAAVKEPDSSAKVGELGMFYFVQQDYSAAIDCFERAGRRDPRNAKWPYLLGISHEALFDARNASESYRAAKDLKPDYPPILLSLGEILLDESKLEEARRLFQQADQLLPGNPRCLWALAACAEKTGDQALAVKLLQEAVAISPGYGQAHAALSRIFRGQGNASEAATHDAQAADGGSPPIFGDPWLIELICHVRDPAQIVANAEMQMSAGRIGDAMRILQSAVSANVATFEIRNNLGVLFAGAGQYEKAAEQFRAILAAEKDAGVLGNLGQCLLGLGRHQEAEKHMRASLALDPRNVPVRQYYAQLLAATNRGELAGKEFRKAIEIEPDNADLRSAFGKFLEDSKNPSEARAQYEEALRQNPTALDAQIGVIRIALARRDYDEAESLLYSGLKRLGDVPILAEQLAYMQATRPDVSRRNPESAVTWASKAVEKTRRKNPEYLHTLAIAYAADGKFPLAVQTAKEAISLAETAKNESLAKTLRSSLAQFESGKPVSESP